MLKLNMFGHDPIIESDDNFEVDPREEAIRSEMYLTGCSYVEAAMTLDRQDAQGDLSNEIPF